MATRINGLPPMPPAGAPAWQEHRTPDGRFYYYNPMTKVTQWTKPEEMMTPAERALLNQPWKEYTAEGGRKYWYNAETKQTTWDMPEVFRRALGGGSPTTPATPAAPFLPQAPARPAHGGLGFESGPHENYRDQRDGPIGESRQLTFGNNAPIQSFVPASNEPEYSSPEEAEAAFVKLLKRMNVQPDWSWEQALRVIVKDPQYRAIRDPKDRKAAFEQFCHDVIAQDKERARERLTKLRADFTTMLKRHPEIKYYTRWKTARPMIEGETAFRSTNDESERRLLFDEYVQELRKAQREAQATTRKSAMDGLIELLQTIDIQPSTRWSEAQAMIQSAPPFKQDEKYRSLSRYDMLTAFQNHLRTLERTFNQSRQDEKAKKQRKERQARDAFLDLLNDLKRDGKIKAGTKWTQIFPLIENQPAYKNMVGQGGSTPLELFWDVLEEAENSLRTTRNDVWDVLEDKRFEVTAKTTFPEFLAVLQDDRRSANIDRDTLTLIFERLQEKKMRRLDDDKVAERQQRRAVDDFRSLLRRIDPPINLDDTFSTVKSRLERYEEFQAVATDDARRLAFDKHIRRLREKEDEAERDRKRRRERGTEPYRDRDRDDRLHHVNGSARPVRSSRSPEHDPYEADRRKAIAERERNHRKSTLAESVLASSDRRSNDAHYEHHRDRDRDRDSRRDRDRNRDRDRDRDRERERDKDRDRGDYDRLSRPRRDEESHYDRERRDREDERELNYRRRVDRDVNELHYGDAPPTPSRRRRADDDSERRDSRDSKRLRKDYDSPRRERSPPRDGGGTQSSKTPQRVASGSVAPAKEPEKEKEGYHSGSEEGEIEED